jgi:hypothetical protein
VDGGSRGKKTTGPTDDQSEASRNDLDPALCRVFGVRVALWSDICICVRPDIGTNGKGKIGKRFL